MYSKRFTSLTMQYRLELKRNINDDSNMQSNDDYLKFDEVIEDDDENENQQHEQFNRDFIVETKNDNIEFEFN